MFVVPEGWDRPLHLVVHRSFAIALLYLRLEGFQELYVSSSCLWGCESSLDQDTGESPRRLVAVVRAVLGKRAFPIGCFIDEGRVCRPRRLERLVVIRYLRL